MMSQGLTHRVFSILEMRSGSGHFIVFFSLLLKGLLQRGDVHLLLPQAGDQGQGLLGPG